MDELNFTELDVLRLMQNHYKRSEDTAKALDDKAQQTITISSVIAGLISAFNLTQGPLSVERKLILIALFVVYAVAFGLSIHALFPRKWKGEPLEADWDEYKKVVRMHPFDYYEWVIEAYIEAIDTNAHVISIKQRDIELAMGAVLLQVFIVFVIIIALP